VSYGSKRIAKLGDDRTDSGRTQESGERSDDMDEKDGEIAHLSKNGYPPGIVGKPAIRHRQLRQTLSG